MTPLVLSLFPGIGLLDMAFEAEGFCVVRGPDLLWGGDIHRFHPPAGKFDGVIGGPPCQAFSRLAFLVKHNGYQVAPNLIPEFERCVREAAPAWFLMENVPDAPLPKVEGYHVSDYVLNNRWFGGVQNRERRFSWGRAGGWQALPYVEDMVDRQSRDFMPAVLASGGGADRPVSLDGNGRPPSSGRIRKARDLGDKTRSACEGAAIGQGLSPDFLAKAPFTVAGRLKAIGNGVPLPMGRAVARAVKRALTPAE